MCKKKAQRKHAKRRAAERFGINLSQRLQDLWVSMIQNRESEAEFVEAQSNRTTVWDISHDDKVVRVVYDKKRKQIVTVLPTEDALTIL